MVVMYLGNINKLAQIGQALHRGGLSPISARGLSSYQQESSVPMQFFEACCQGISRHLKASQGFVKLPSKARTIRASRSAGGFLSTLDSISTGASVMAKQSRALDAGRAGANSA